MLKKFRCCLNKLFQMSFFKRCPKFSIRAFIERIQIEAECARKQHRILGDDCDPRTEVMKRNSCDVNIIDENSA